MPNIMGPSLIFLSLGTHEAPFTRAVDLVTPLATSDRPLLIQHGHTPIKNGIPHITWEMYMSYDEVIQAMTDAEMVICHAGVGTIMTALKLGHRPIVIPRLQQNNEHVDNHQHDIANRLADRGLVICLKPNEPVPSGKTVEGSSRDMTARAGEQLRAAVTKAVSDKPRRRSNPLKRLIHS
jgi:UDP-N-acetylglucosamine--N-acetylmuramyl-(pentapeptide) pyrophosphoryl-undecaprenol N-acetylglucosamine transferase